MNWLGSGSSSFSGLLTKAQKSIDKVLDIPGDDDASGKKTGGNSDTGASKSSQPQSSKESKKTSEEKSSSTGSWLSGTDSFWGSFTQNTSSTSTDTPQTKENNSPSNVEVKKKSTSERSNDFSQKGSKPSKALSLKQTNKRGSSKKKRIPDDQDKKNLEAKNKEKSDLDAKTETTNNLHDTLSGSNKPKDVDFNEANSDGILEDLLDGRRSEFSNNDSLLMSKNENTLNNSKREIIDDCKVMQKETKVTEMMEDVLLTQNSEDFQAEQREGWNFEVETLQQVDNVESPEEQTSQDIHTQDSEKVKETNQTSPMFDVDMKNVLETDKKFLGNEDKQEKRLEEQELVPESVENLDLFSSVPVAASTPQKKEQFPEKRDSDDQELAGENDLKDLHQDITITEMQTGKEEGLLNLESKDDKELSFTSGVMDIQKGVEEEQVKNEINGQIVDSQENERLRKIIEVRESKMVELSRENLNLQETNVVLRSQIEQLEEVNKSEDAELEQMKEEFTKRIGESEAKLHTAAKERDQFKKQLEETEKCLSSDIQRQLKDFQSLTQEKDEQIAQLMEEGEKLSKEILQRNTNIKKLRAKEKELNTSNESLSKRLEEAETEIERLNGILKARDDHEREQDDAIKKLNAHTKKQEDVIAKQKVELEESAAKLPSLQTALDNAYKEITELHKVNAAKSNEVQEATLSVEMTAKEELRIALEKLKKESQKECDVLAMEVTDLQTQMNRSEQQAARREDNLRQEISDVQMRLQEAETRNQELTQSVSVATRPLLRQIENLQHSYGSQQTSWEKLEKTLTDRLADAQGQLAAAQEKERASTERSLELSSKVASLELQVTNYRQEKSRIEAEFELEKGKLEELEDFKSRETGKIEALKTRHSKQLETMMVEKSLLEQQLVVERTKYESEQKKLTKLEEQLKEKFQKVEDIGEMDNEQNHVQHTTLDRRHSRNSSSSSVFSLTDTMTRSLSSGGTAVLEELQATIRHKEGELVSMQSAISTLESSRESLTEELTSLMSTNENLSKENKQLKHIGKSFQELQTKYNALLQMYGEKQEETEELKLDLQDIKNMYKAQIQELLSGR